MNGKLCLKMDSCSKISRLREKDLPRELFILCVYNICSKCPERLVKSDNDGHHYVIREKIAKFIYEENSQIRRHKKIQSFHECSQSLKQTYYKEADQVIAMVNSYSSQETEK